MINVICVNANNYLGRGWEYVEALERGVSHYLNRPYRFVVLTETDTEPDVLGWWNKLYLFQPGRFHGRCLYFDLDTVICGPIDEIASYDGDFAGIEDFYAPRFLQTGVMAWEAGKADHIFTTWQNAKKPQFHPSGDGGWVHDMMGGADRLQTKFPGQIVSFKQSCMHGVPDGVRVVCFHGQPRPHALGDVMRHWIK